MDVVTALRQQRMNPVRWYAVALCILCGAIDGLDLLLVAYALPHLPDGFASGEQKGLLISLAFIGYGIGSALIAPIADRIGRKNLVLAGLVFATLVLAATAFAPNVEVMMVTRLLTGLAVGTMLPLIHVLGDEYASQNRRSLSVGIITLGVPIGSLLGGLASLFVISTFDGAWQALFVFGATMTGIVAVLVWLTLPESPVFLANRGRDDDEVRVAAIAKRLRLVGVDPSMKPTPEVSAPTTDDAESRDTKIGVLSSRYRVRSLLIWGGYTFGILGYYFINSWTPQLITTATDSAATGALVTTVISIGAITGGVLFTLMTLRVIPTRLCWIALAVAVVAQVTFALTLSGAVAYVSAFILGMGIQAGLSAYMTSATRLYPPVIRARGLGLMGGISRVGSITAPLLVGALLTVVTAEVMYLAASVTVLIAGLAAFALWANTKHEFVEPTAAAHESLGDSAASPTTLSRT